jgi:hypothetical protein
MPQGYINSLMPQGYINSLMPQGYINSLILPDYKPELGTFSFNQLFVLCDLNFNFPSQ